MKLKKAIIIEDNDLYSAALKQSLSNNFKGNIEIFEDPDTFAEKYFKPSQMESVEFIVLDYVFDSYNASEKDMIQYIRDKLQYYGTLVLWSLDDNIPEKFSNKCSHIFPKKYLNYLICNHCFKTNES